MLQLMNSTMMPQEGHYTCRKIDKDEFSKILLQHVENGPGFKSSIGYQQTADIIEHLSGVKVPLSRESTILNDGDLILVCKLKYRVKNPATKGNQARNEDFEFFEVTYRSI